MPRRLWAARPRRQVSATYHGSLTHLRVGARERYHKLSGDGLTRSSTVTKATDGARHPRPRRASGRRDPKQRATPGRPKAWVRRPGIGRGRRKRRSGRAGHPPRAGSAGAAAAGAAPPEARLQEARAQGAPLAGPASGRAASGPAGQEPTWAARARPVPAAASRCRPPGVPIRCRPPGVPIRCRPPGVPIQCRRDRALASRSIARRPKRRRTWRAGARAATTVASAST